MGNEAALLALRTQADTQTAERMQAAEEAGRGAEGEGIVEVDWRALERYGRERAGKEKGRARGKKRREKRGREADSEESEVEEEGSWGESEEEVAGGPAAGAVEGEMRTRMGTVLHRRKRRSNRDGGDDGSAEEEEEEETRTGASLSQRRPAQSVPVRSS